jgi:zinc transport system substrate-binding protein
MEEKDTVRFPAVFIVPVISLLALSLSCGSGREAGRAGKLIAVSIMPQAYFAGRIGGSLAEIMVLAGPGQNPHSYEPTPRQFSELSRAAVWVLSGTEFEISLRAKIESLFPSLPIVDGTVGVRFRSLEAHGHEGEGEEDGNLGSSGGEASMERDRHTWLGLEPARIMAFHIRDALCAADGANAAIYRENCEALVRDMEDAFGGLRRELAPLRGKTVFVYHPAFGYFLDEFGIIQEAVETGGKEPTPRILGQLIEKARAEKVKVIFVQAQFPSEAARTAANAAGAELVSLDPLAADWLSNIRTMGEALKRAAEL